MSTALEKTHLTEVTIVENVSVTEENLTWTHTETSESASRHELVLVHEVTNSQSGSSQYLLFILKEDPEKKEMPFQLSILKTKEIPSDLRSLTVAGLPTHLKRSSSNEHGVTNQVDIIVSIKSGIGLASKVWEDVFHPLWTYIAGDTSGESSYGLIHTGSSETIRDYAKQLWNSNERSKVRTVVLLSGDGGVVDLLNGSGGNEVPENPPTIALLPLGTGNALFHSTHKPLYSEPGPSPLVLGLRTLFLGVGADLPVFRASFSSGSHIVKFTDKSKEQPSTPDPNQLQKQETSITHLQGAIVASYGFHASLVHESDTPEYRVHGDKRFHMVAEGLLKESHPYAAKVSIRRRCSTTFEDIPRESHAYVLTALVSNMERKFAISPATKPLQSQLRLVHFGPIGGERTMSVMMKAYDEGSHVGMQWPDGEKVGYDEVDEVKISVLEKDERWRKVCIDGTIVEIPEGGSMSIKMLDHSLFKILASPVVLESREKA
ncbi:ATP-NAD kinase-like domain-containing protein [Fusarium redolens]|uniref:ATP-NAD kinase-like domain-containing protein n=1 Tax=Fusarium redolens TaxID=48865 RepID=A0A9P9H354_FUSRE|nr:ATP-NAD kinase-like domain-containing protein [Fusarium redolens]KAH7248977.1 ATP-NAD kinase-like domain-containing protein [Fusarium redolens]